MPTTAQIEAGLRQARDRGFLWRISKDGRESYLSGTLHVGRLEWAYPGPALARAVKSVDTIALEMDMQDPDILGRMQAGIAQAPRHPLPADLQRRIAQAVQRECLPPSFVSSMPPDMLVEVLGVMSGRRDGLYIAFGADTIYGSMAGSMGKPVHSLESPELQLGILLAANPEDALRRVQAGLDELERGRSRQLVSRMGTMWAEGRFDELQRYESWCECTATPADRRFLSRLLDERNPGLADGIDRLHASGGKVFAAVGALHMIGANGLPALMARRGYDVERVVFGGP